MSGIRRMLPDFEGAFVALVTPFKKGKVDYPKLRELVAFQLSSGMNGIVLCATTGEAPTLSDAEKIRIIKQTVRQVRGRIPVIVYTGSNDTRRTIEFTHIVQQLKVSAALVVVPYYNKPTQEGMYRHFKAVAESVKLPIILYNVPSRTVVSLTAETVSRLTGIKNIVAIKEASGNFDEITRLKLLSDLSAEAQAGPPAGVKRRAGITILSGEDSITYPMLTLGAKGVISVVANIIPREVASMVQLHLNGLTDEARKLHYQIYPLARAMFIETSPIPVKTAMKLLGRSNGELRLPLTAMSPENTAKLKTVLSRWTSGRIDYL